jgi:signal peptide peptidase SppA
MSNPRIAAGTPWMIREDAFRSIAARSPGSVAMPANWQAPRMGRTSRSESAASSDPSSCYQVVNGVAVVPIYGPIYRHSTPLNDFMAYLFGGVSVDSLTDCLREAADASDVKAIMLAIDSPGGEAAGIGELAGMIRQISEAKPVAAYCEAMCCSAGYYLASAAQQITAAPSAMVGCIGTVICLVDDSKYQDEIGIKDVPIVSAQSPRKWPDIATEGGRNEYQVIVDAMAAIFISDVAKYRGVDEAKVLADFGQGASLVGDAARKAGLVDKIGTADDVMRKLSGANRNRMPGIRATARPLNSTVAPSVPAAPIRIGAKLIPNRSV